jgi:hypothetical protein
VMRQVLNSETPGQILQFRHALRSVVPLDCRCCQAASALIRSQLGPSLHHADRCCRLMRQCAVRQLAFLYEAAGAKLDVADTLARRLIIAK